MAGARIKSGTSGTAELRLSDYLGQSVGVDIAQGAGHSTPSQNVHLSHFYRGYASGGFGDGLKFWEDVADGGNIPTLGGGGGNPTEMLGTDPYTLDEIKFSDFYNAKQQTNYMEVKEFTASEASTTNTVIYGYADNPAVSGISDTLGSLRGTHFNHHIGICGIDADDGWRIAGYYAKFSSGSPANYKQFLHVKFDDTVASLSPTNSGWTTVDVGKWSSSHPRSADGAPTVTKTSQMQRSSCTFVSNYGTHEVYWVQDYGSNVDPTIYDHRNEGEIDWVLIMDETSSGIG